MPTRWMAYTPQTGWGELTEEQAVEFRKALRMELRVKVPRLVEGCKLVCIPEPFKLSDMKRPVMVVSKDFDGQAFCAALNAAGVTDFPELPVRVSEYLEPGTIMFTESHPQPMALSKWL